MKLAIVGSGQETRNNAPWNDKGYDVWVFNEAANQSWCKRWDACFQLHKPMIYTGPNTKDIKHWEWLQEKHGKPIYMQSLDSRVPDCVDYPLQDVITLAGMSYLSSTVCFALALAVLQGYEQIDLYGIEMSFSEYQYQSECYRFWVGFAKGRGIKVNLYSGQHLFESPLYGYEGNDSFDPQYFKDRAAFLDGAWQASEKHLAGMKGLIEKLLERDEFDKARESIKEYQVAAMQGGENAGALAEAERYAGQEFTDRGLFEYNTAKAQKEGEEKRVKMWTTAGMVEYVWNVWKQTKNVQAKNQLAAFIMRYSQEAYDTGALQGVYSENIKYILKYDEMVQANGGHTAPSPVTIPQMEKV